MKKRAGILIGLIAGIVLTLAGTGGAQIAVNLIRGGGHGGTESEGWFRFRTVKGGIHKVDIDRAVLKVRGTYGEPYAVTALGGNRVAIWYKNEQDVLRNVVVNNAETLLKVELQDAKVK